MKGSMVRKPVPFKVTSTSSPAANSLFDTWGIGKCMDEYMVVRLSFLNLQWHYP